jgi:DnaJ domain
MDEETVLRRCQVRAESLGLSSTETFVFSQIDGATPLTELADLTGIPLEKVISIAGRLAALGIVDEGTATGAGSSGEQRAAPVIPPPMDGDLLRVPHRTARDVYALKLDPADAFFLSNVDNRLSIEELADIAGYDPARALRSTEALVKAGALELHPPMPRGMPASGRRLPVAEGGGNGAAKSGKRALSKPPVPAKAASPIATPAVEPTDHGGCDLDAEIIAKIDVALVGLSARTHYGILGLPRGASNKEIRRAYFALAGILHPDRYFRKKLGPYKKKLAAAFEKVTASYELLRIEGTRAAYDAHLVLTREPEEVTIAFAPPAPAPAAPTESPVGSAAKRRSMRPTKAPKGGAGAATIPAIARAIEPTIDCAPTMGRSIRPSKAPKSGSAAKVSAIPPMPAPAIVSGATKGRSIRPSKAPKGRASAAKMAAITAPAPDARAAATPTATAAVAVKAASKSAPLLAEAQKALIQGDAAAAANLYRLALQFAEDGAARRYAESGMNEARSMLADGYAKTARSEEKARNWGATVAAYAKALDLRPQDAALSERLANALREEGVDLARATRLAELAVSRAPRRAAYQKTLGRILMQAGQGKEALERLEGAFAIEPDEATAQLIARLRKRAPG